MYRSRASSNMHLSVARTLKPIQSDTTTDLIKLLWLNRAIKWRGNA
jgi:hypothetical protein